jgi:O-antigen ligase
MLVIGNILVLVIKTGSFKLKRKYVLALVSALVVFLLIFIASEDARNLSLVTYSRFTADTIGDGESNLLSGESDKFRGNIYNYANELIKDNWLFGIGYLNFMPLYAVEFNMPDQITPTGKIVSGTSVHNSYQAWLLEGGIPLVVIVVSILFRYFKILRQRIKLSNSERDVLLYKVLAIVMIQQLAYGLYHTVQHTQMFWMSLGFVFALKYKFSIEDALGERHRTRDYSSKSEYRKKIITATSPVV